MQLGKLGGRGGFGSGGSLAGARGYGPPGPVIAAPSAGMIFDGNSITESPGAVPAGTEYPAQFTTNTGKTSYNVGHSGYTLEFMGSNFTTNIGPVNGANRGLVLDGGINDIIQGKTAAQVISFWQAYSVKARAAGFNVGAGKPFAIRTIGVCNYTGQWDATKQGHLDAANAWLVANYASIADTYINDRIVPRLSNPDDTAYFVDKLHPTAQGRRALAEGARLAFGIPTLADVTPNAFAFTDVSNATVSTLYTSNLLQLSGFTDTVPLTVSRGEFNLNGSGWLPAAAATTIQPWDTLQVRETSSSSGGTTVNLVVTAGGTSDTYSIATAVPYTGPGDILPSALAWYGLRAYNAAYIGGPAIDIVRASDGATMTVNTVSGGGLDPAMATFLNATTGKVTRIYDQTGNGRHLGQVTGASQPALTQNASGSKPAITVSSTGPTYLTGVSSITQAQPFSQSIVAKHSGANPGLQIIFSETGAPGATYFSATPGNVGLFSGNQVTVAAADNVFHSLQSVFNGSSSSLMVDGSASGALNPGTAGIANPLNLNNAVFPTNGLVAEAGLWAGVTSGSNQTALNNNQRAYWGF